MRPGRRAPDQRESILTSAAPSPAAPSRLVHLSVALDDAGWHPAAWREPRARPAELLDGRVLGGSHPAGRARPAGLRHHRGRAQPAVRPLRPARPADRPGPRTARRRADRGARGAPHAAHRAGADGDRHPYRAVSRVQGDRHAGLRQHRAGRGADPGVARPARGRAVRPAQTSRPPPPADNGRPEAAEIADGFDEAADYVEVLRRLWDSWEDDAEIRDAATGRFVDVSKLHYIDFQGRWFSVKGPSITPRPPQGQPVVAALGHGAVAVPADRARR